MEKVYSLTIVYDEDSEEIEYISEEITSESTETIIERGSLNIADYFDEDGLKLITGCYIVGEA